MKQERYRLIVLLTAILVASSAPGASQDLRSDLARRRQAVAEKMNGRGMLILFSGEPKRYSGDVFYEFRQENNIYYLTGIRQSGITLVLMPQNETFQEILFLPDRNPRAELWTGRMLSREEAREISGIANIWSDSEFETFLDSVLNGRLYRVNRYLQPREYQDFFSDLNAGNARVFLLLESKPGLKGKLTPEFQFGNQLKERFIGIAIRDATNVFEELRAVKSPYEIAQLREAIQITGEALREAMRQLRPGLWEYEVEAIVEYIFKKRNSFDWGFPSIIGSGPNATTLHYQESQRRLKEGDLLLMDIGAERNHYSADITRTVPVNGKFTPEQAEIYQLVLDAQKAAMEKVKPGASLPRVHEAAVEVIKKGLLRLGLLTNSTTDQYRIYFPHGVGHFLGMDVHDVQPAGVFRPGMVITVEPGIYVREDSLERLKAEGMDQKDLERIRLALERYIGIGVRIEDDLLITDGGFEVLSEGAPREIKEVEGLVGTAKML